MTIVDRVVISLAVLFGIAGSLVFAVLLVLGPDVSDNLNNCSTQNGLRICIHE